VVEDDYPHWRNILNGFDYGADVEITDVEIRGITAKRLDGEGFLEIHEAPPLYRTREGSGKEPDAVELVEMLKHSVRDIAADLLATEGIGSHELGYLYNVLMDHVRAKLLRGQSAGAAEVTELKHALNHLSRLAENLRERPGLVASIVKYKEEADHADERAR